MILAALLVAGALWFSLRYAWWRPAADQSWPRILMYHMIAEPRAGARFNGLRVSPAMFEQQLMPVYKRMIDRFEAANPDIIPILHCDGAVSQLLPQIREIGFEVFNPVQPGVPGHGVGIDHGNVGLLVGSSQIDE